jgi:hypothetical protein
MDGDRAQQAQDVGQDEGETIDEEADDEEGVDVERIVYVDSDVPLVVALATSGEPRSTGSRADEGARLDSESGVKCDDSSARSSVGVLSVERAIVNEASDEEEAVKWLLTVEPLRWSRPEVVPWL